MRPGREGRRNGGAREGASHQQQGGDQDAEPDLRGRGSRYTAIPSERVGPHPSVPVEQRRAEPSGARHRLQAIRPAAASVGFRGVRWKRVGHPHAGHGCTRFIERLSVRRRPGHKSPLVVNRAAGRPTASRPGPLSVRWETTARPIVRRPVPPDHGVRSRPGWEVWPIFGRRVAEPRGGRVDMFRPPGVFMGIPTRGERLPPSGAPDVRKLGCRAPESQRRGDRGVRVHPPREPTA